MTDPVEVPIFQSPVHMQCDVGPVAAWLTSPPGIVVQVTEPAKMTTSMASWIVGPAFDRMLARFSRAGDFVFMLDLRAMTARDAKVRSLFMNLARDSGAMLRATVIIPPRRANPLYLAGLQTASALVSVVAPTLEVTSAVSDVLRRYRLVAAD